MVQRRKLPKALRWWTTLSHKAPTLDACKQVGASFLQEAGASNDSGGGEVERDETEVSLVFEKADAGADHLEAQGGQHSSTQGASGCLASQPHQASRAMAASVESVSGGELGLEHDAVDEQGRRTAMEEGRGPGGAAEQPSEIARVLLERKELGSCYDKAGRAAGGRSRKVTARLVPDAQDPDNFVLELQESASMMNTPLISPCSTVSSPVCMSRYQEHARAQSTGVGAAWEGESDQEDKHLAIEELRGNGGSQEGNVASAGPDEGKGMREQDSGVEEEEEELIGRERGHAQKLGEAVERDWRAAEAKLVEYQIVIGALEDEVRRREQEVDRAVGAQARMRSCCAWAVMLVAGCRGLINEVLQSQAELEGRLMACSDACDDVARIRASCNQALQDLRNKVDAEVAARGMLQCTLEEERRRSHESCRAEDEEICHLLAQAASIEEASLRLGQALHQAAAERQRKLEEEKGRREEERGRRRESARQSRILESELKQEMRRRALTLVDHFAQQLPRCHRHLRQLAHASAFSLADQLSSALPPPRLRVT